MPIVISTTNTPGQSLAAIIDKVTTDGVDVSPPLRWDQQDSSFNQLNTFPTVQDAYNFLDESSSIPGYYEVIIGELDGAAENVRITIVNAANDRALGILYNIPTPVVAPEFTIDLTVTEDRD